MRAASNPAVAASRPKVTIGVAALRVAGEVVAAYLALGLLLTVLRASAAQAGDPMEGSGASGWNSHAATLLLLVVAGSLLGWRLRHRSPRWTWAATTALGAVVSTCAWRWQRWLELAFDPLIWPSEPRTTDGSVVWFLLLTAIGSAPGAGAALILTARMLSQSWKQRAASDGH